MSLTKKVSFMDSIKAKLSSAKSDDTKSAKKHKKQKKEKKHKPQQVITYTPVIPPIPAPVSGPVPTSVPTKRALLIGINYLSDSRNRLNGCINDVKSVKELLTGKFSYDPSNVVLMSDDQTGPMLPTKENILSQLNKAVSLTKPGDTLFIHYSGHGIQVTSLNDDEKTNEDTPNQDDCICPCDFNNYAGNGGFILDDLLKEIVVNKIPAGAKLRAFFDCCHSGSVLDLEYIWKKDGDFAVSSAPELQSDDILLISGCRDSQTSADTYNAQKQQAMGALTMMLLKALANIGEIQTTWRDLLLLTRHYLADGGYPQFPMISVANKNTIYNVIDL